MQKYADYLEKIEIDSLWSGRRHVVWELDRKVNLVYPYPVFSRITFEAYNLPDTAKYIKIVFPNYEGVQYKCGSGKVVDVINTDIQLSKVVFVTNQDH